MKFDETRLVEQLYPTTGSSTREDIEFYVRSSVLGGSVLTELNENGGKVLTNIYIGSEALAEQRTNALTSDYVVWHHKDPVTGSFDSSVKSGVLFGDDEPEFKAEFEPLGAVLPQEDPAFDPDIDPMPVQYRKRGGGNPFEPEIGCMVDGFWDDYCNAHLRANTAVQCPNNDCNPRVFVDSHGRYGFTRPFYAFGDGGGGFQVYIPGRPFETPDSEDDEETIRIGSTGNHPGKWLILGETDVVFAGFNEQQLKMIGKALDDMANENCMNAFANAGLKFPGDVIDSGVTILKAGLLDSPSDMREFGLDSDSKEDLAFRGEMLKFAGGSGSIYYNEFTSEKPYKGRIFMVLKQRGFNETDVPFAETFVHAWMHATGAVGRNTHPISMTTIRLSRIPGQRFPTAPVIKTTTIVEVPNEKGEHDLTWMNKDLYDTIIKNCTSK